MTPGAGTPKVCNPTGHVTYGVLEHATPNSNNLEAHGTVDHIVCDIVVIVPHVVFWCRSLQLPSHQRSAMSLEDVLTYWHRHAGVLNMLADVHSMTNPTWRYAGNLGVAGALERLSAET